MQTWGLNPPQTLQTSPETPSSRAGKIWVPGQPHPSRSCGFCQNKPCLTQKGSSGKGCSTRSQLRCSQSPLQLNQLGTIFKSGLSNSIYFRFLKLMVSRKVGNVHMTHPRAVTPLWAHGRGWETAEKNSIPIKIYQFPKQEDLGFTFYTSQHFFPPGTKTFNPAPGSVARKEFGADFFFFFAVLISPESCT